MNLTSGLGNGRMWLRRALVCLCPTLVIACQTEQIALSPPLHTRVVDGLSGKPLDSVRVTLRSVDHRFSETAYSDGSGVVSMPALMGWPNVMFPFVTDEIRPPVHAVFERPGYRPYIIDAVNGYGFFKGYRDVRLFSDHD